MEENKGHREKEEEVVPKVMDNGGPNQQPLEVKLERENVRVTVMSSPYLVGPSKNTFNYRPPPPHIALQGNENNLENRFLNYLDKLFEELCAKSKKRNGSQQGISLDTLSKVRF